MNITLGSDDSVAVSRGEKITRGQSRSKLIKVNWRLGESPPELPISNTKHIGIESLVVQVNITRPDGEYSGWQDMIKVDGEISYYYPLQKWDTEVPGKAWCQIRWFKAGDDGDDDDTTVQTSNQVSFVIDNGAIAQTLLPTLTDYTTWQAIIAGLQASAFKKYDASDLPNSVIFNINGKKSAPAIYYNYSDGTNTGTMVVVKEIVSANVIQTELLISNGRLFIRSATFIATEYQDSSNENPVYQLTPYSCMVGITLDEVLSLTSINPVQNKIVTTALHTKADKVSGAVAGDFAGLDENGNLTDSGKKPSDYYTKTEIDGQIFNLYKPQGTATISSLNSLTKTANMNGYVWDCSGAGTLTNSDNTTISVLAGDNVVLIWNNGNWYWDNFGGIVDLTGYYTKTETDNLLNGKVNTSNVDQEFFDNLFRKII